MQRPICPVPNGQGNRIYIKKVLALAIGIENNDHFDPDPDSDSDCEVEIAGKIINAVSLFWTYMVLAIPIILW